MSETFALYFESHFIGDIREAFEHQGTWFGTFVGSRSDVPNHIVQYIEFCRDWHQRLEEDPKKGTDAAEFDAFSDVIYSGHWTVHQGDKKLAVDRAPIFPDHSEISWLLK